MDFPLQQQLDTLQIGSPRSGPSQPLFPSLRQPRKRRLRITVGDEESSDSQSERSEQQQQRPPLLQREEGVPHFYDPHRSSAPSTPFSPPRSPPSSPPPPPPLRQRAEGERPQQPQYDQPPVAAPIYLPVDLTFSIPRFIPTEDEDFRRNYAIATSTNNFPELKRRLLERYEIGPHNYQSEVAEKIRREQQVDGDPQARQTTESEIDFLLKRARYWELIDRDYCFLCSHVRAHGALDRFEDVKRMNDYVDDHFEHMNEDTLITNLWDIYNTVIRGKFRPPFCDPYTNQPRPPPFYSKAQIAAHYFQHIYHPEIQRVLRLRTFLMTFQEVAKKIKSVNPMNPDDVKIHIPSISILQKVNKTIRELERDRNKHSRR